MALSKKSFLGVAREATSGTAIATPTLYVPTKSMAKAKKKREVMDEERGDRNAQYDVIDTIRWAEWDAKGPWYNDSMLYFLIAAMGSEAPTQPNAAAPTVYKHTISLADTPPSLTVFKSFDAKTYYMAYSVVEKFSFKFSADKILEADFTGKGIWPTKYTGSALTPTFSSVKPFAGFSPTITLASGVTSDIVDLQLDFEQKITLWNPANGSQDWITAYFGERKCMGSFTARFDSDALYENYYRAYTNNSPTMDTLTIDFLGPLLGKVYTVTLGAPSAGTFSLTYGGQTASGIAYNAAAAAVQTALQGLTSVGASNVTVTGSAGGPYTISFLNGTLNDNNALTGNGATLTGGTFSVGAQSSYNQELNLKVPVITYDDMEHDLGKDNVMIKAKWTGLAQGAGAGNNLLQIFAQNAVASYTV